MLNSRKLQAILHLNMSSLSKHFEERNFLLSKLNHKFSVIGISETRLKLRYPDSEHLDFVGYKYNKTRTVSHAGGFGLYIDNSFAKVKIRCNRSMQLENEIESIFIEVE